MALLLRSPEKGKGTAEHSPDPEPEETQSRLQLPLAAESLGSWNLLVPARVPAVQRQIGPVSVGGERDS